MLDRFTPLSLQPPKIACNRLVVPPMASTTANPGGAATAATVAHYARLAEAGAGITFVEYTYVDWTGRSEPNQLGLASAAHARALAEVAKVLRASGTLPGLQLTHAGGKTEREYTGGVLMGPSDVPVPVKDRTLEAPTPMTPADIVAWQEAFVTAAERGAGLGFDLIELHAAHGYGLNQWLSPLTNRRSDSYGGTTAGRARILLEIVETLRIRLPQVTVAVRVPGQDFLPGGLSQVEARQIAQLLVQAGVGLIDVSSGLGGWRRPRDRSGEGYLVEEAAFIQAGVAAPVIGVGGIESGAFIDKALAAGKLSFAAVGRAILADPAGWREREMRARRQEPARALARDA